MRRVLQITGAFAALVLQACTTRVSVVDQTGRPVAGARIEPVSLSINHFSVTTDEDGMASIPWHMQQIEWLHVSKKGFKPKKDIKFLPSGLMTVELNQ